MLDQLRSDIKARLDDLLGEADKLRQALTALGSRENAPAPPLTARSAPSVTRAPARSVQPPGERHGADGSVAGRAAPGATKNAILNALANGSAMTAGEIATTTGLGRGTVSSTLSRLVKTGEVTKAERGYKSAVRISG